MYTKLTPLTPMDSDFGVMKEYDRGLLRQQLALLSEKIQDNVYSMEADDVIAITYAMTDIYKTLYDANNNDDKQCVILSADEREPTKHEALHSLV